MKTVILRGPVLTQSGYGVHSRQVAKWLLGRKDLAVKFQVTPWGDTPWYLAETACDGLIGEIMRKTVGPSERADVSFQVQLPNEWDRTLGTKNVGITASVETDRCNPEWVAAVNRMDLVLVPSEHTKASFTNTAQVTSKLSVVPESYSEAIFKSNEGSIEFSTPFNFLIFGQFTGNNPYNDRKNTFFTIKWLCETFKDNPDVGIVIKTNSGRNSKIDAMLTKSILTTLLSECRKGPFPRVHLLHGDMSDNEVAAIYRSPQIKALVTLTRGEGYGLPILEAAVSGLPIIATGWSGHMDFLKHGKFVNVFYELNEIHQTRVDNKIFMKGARWANASEHDFKKRVQKFYESPGTPREWAADLSKKLAESHSYDKIAAAYDTATVELL